MRVSADGVLGAIYLSTIRRIVIYQFMGKEEELLCETKINKPKAELQILECEEFQTIHDLHIFWNPKSETKDVKDYQMYVLSDKGILLYPNINSNNLPKVIMNDPEYTLTPGLHTQRITKSKENLFVGVTKYNKEDPSKDDHYIKVIEGGVISEEQDFEVADSSEKLYTFDKFLVEVKHHSQNSQVKIYDTQWNMTTFWHPPANGRIIDV